MQRLANWQLFAVCVLTWATTWYAVTFEVASLAPEYGVAMRFGLAGALVLAACAARGHRVGCNLRDHALLMLQGTFLYGVSYVGVYHAERHIASGLVAVGYSASPLVTGLGARVVFGVRLGRTFVPGGLLGLAGVALIFWPEFAPGRRGPNVELGAAFTVASVLLSAIGSVAASRNRVRGIAFWPALGWGMVYGALAATVVGAARGAPFVVPMAGAWWVAFAYLVLAGSILTFACFLTLQDRIGPGPTGTIGVMTPLIALLVSMVFEGFRAETPTLVGIVLAVLGNALMLRPSRRPARAAASSAPD
jgi:drug/metabolite transporter (DMT)-like permease